ncbi:MAG: hemolysin family protein [Melioribacteraceae bacterium]|nr:hemolysin family protein [Melioribacteraceae bacterium]MCF8352935.1 hemolysin family protein [Melioribacteraceae bacterium]MCF8395871.1 hemolysin family protein [Melioribacteraceae bacterium]MCF8417452.1 hemolysin family protein [Melioribacteraceae bacterium]
MDIDWFLKLFGLAALLILSGFFSGSEVALFSLDKKKIKILKKEKGILAQYITNLLEFPRRLLVTILLGNTVINVGASIIGVLIALKLAPILNISVELALTIEIIILTILIILIAELTPKIWASKQPLKFAKLVAIPLYWTSVLIYPVTKTVTDIIKLISVKFKHNKTAISAEELTELADLGAEAGTIEEEEQDLIHGLVGFKKISAHEIMTPRVDVISVSVDSTFETVMTTITNSGHSRIPLYEGSLDNVIGIIYAKDLLKYLGKDESQNEFNLRKIARKAMFVPENKFISDLMKEFQEKNMHLGIVVDEYGGTAGLISLEDILEEIVGEIRDEYDKEEAEITPVGENSYIVLGKVPIDEINNLFEADFSSENDDYDTIGGFIFNHAGQIPKEGFQVEFNRFLFTVKEVENKRINKVLIEEIK